MADSQQSSKRGSNRLANKAPEFDYTANKTITSSLHADRSQGIGGRSKPPVKSTKPSTTRPPVTAGTSKIYTTINVVNKKSASSAQPSNRPSSTSELTVKTDTPGPSNPSRPEADSNLASEENTAATGVEQGVDNTEQGVDNTEQRTANIEQGVVSESESEKSPNPLDVTDPCDDKEEEDSSVTDAEGDHETFDSAKSSSDSEESVKSNRAPDAEASDRSTSPIARTSPARTPSPARSHSPSRSRSPVRSSTPSKQTSPSRPASPQRTSSPTAGHSGRASPGGTTKASGKAKSAGKKTSGTGFSKAHKTSSKTPIVVMAAQPFISLPAPAIYSGQEHPSPWLISYEEYADTIGWDDDAKYKHVGLYLRDTASLWFQCNKTISVKN